MCVLPTVVTIEHPEVASDLETDLCFSGVQDFRCDTAVFTSICWASYGFSSVTM